MALEKTDFYGKEVTDAIKKACEELGVAQEKLDIEVIETGSTGIFGLIRKKAHIRVHLKTTNDEEESEAFKVNDILELGDQEEGKGKPKSSEIKSDLVEEWSPTNQEKVVKDPEVTPEVAQVDSADEDTTVEKSEARNGSVDEEPSPESIELIRSELLTIVELMGFPSTVDIEIKGSSVSCVLRGEFEGDLAGVDGKVLDSLQYILRKIVSKKVPERLRISLDVGDFRAKRLEELKTRAVELATMVKENGKTQALPALNPSERRAIHMVLQEDKEIRSRSVGDGLFKKILIYKPGKGNRGGRKRSNNKGRPNKSGQGQRQKKNS